MNRCITRNGDDGGLSIMVVEDNPGDYRLLQEMLKTGGLNLKVPFTVADTLNRALIKLTESEFDLIIVDLGLPDCQGLMTFRLIRSHARETPILVLTGLADEGLGIKAIKYGAQDYLVKGQIDGRLLCRSITYAVERFRLERELKSKVDEIERLNRMLHFERDFEVDDLRREIQRLKMKKAG